LFLSDRSEERWSLGIILCECLFGYPPFWASTRRETQKIIIDWINNLEIPAEPKASESAKKLVKALLTDAETRLRTPTWEIDIPTQQGFLVSRTQNLQVFKKDVRNHSFFRDSKIDFEKLHLSRAPPLPTGNLQPVPGSRKNSASKDGKGERSVQPVKTKDVMLRDERVLKERQTKAFKNYTYRGPNITAALEKFAQAIDAGSD
jgi:serine/threonine protein kinase